MNPRSKFPRPSAAAWLATFAICAAAAQGPGAETLDVPRLRAIALQAEPPGPLSRPYVELLDTVADAIDHSTLEVAEDRFERFLIRQRDAGRKGVPGGYVDYILRQAAIENSDAAKSAAARAVYFNAQESAVLEHLSLLEKHYSYQAGTRLPDFILREPVLGVIDHDDDAVRQGLPRNTSTNELPDKIKVWRETLDRVGALRESAQNAFADTVRSDPELIDKLTRADRRLHEAIRDVFGEPEPRSPAGSR